MHGKRAAKRNKKKAVLWPGCAAVLVLLIIIAAESSRRSGSTPLSLRKPTEGFRSTSKWSDYVSWRTLLGDGKVEKPVAESQSLAPAPRDAGRVDFGDQTQPRPDSTFSKSTLTPPAVPPFSHRIHYVPAPVVDLRAELAGYDEGEDFVAPGGRERTFKTATPADRRTVAARVASLRLTDQEKRNEGSLNRFPAPPDDPVTGEPSSFELRDAGDATQRHAVGVAWPRTPRLDEALQRVVTGDDAAAAWGREVQTILDQLQRRPTLGESISGELLDQLAILAGTGLEHGERLVENRPRQIDVLRAAEGVIRRAEVWRAIYKVACREGEGASSAFISSTSSEVVAAAEELPPLEELLDRLQTRSLETGDPQGWQQYFLLAPLRRAAAGAISSTTSGAGAETAQSLQRALQARRILAQRVLSRVDREDLTGEQKEWIEHADVALLVQRLRPWTQMPIDYVSLLAQLERLELEPMDLGSTGVAAAVQTLRFSENLEARSVAIKVNDYYRHGNVRMAVRGPFLQQLLPAVPPRTTPIRQSIVGVPVRGTGVVRTELGLRLVPSTDTWSFELQTQGSIEGRTGSKQWPARLSNDSLSRFTSITPIRIEREGIEIGGTEVQATSQARLRELRTDFDGLPVISSLVRSLVIAQYLDRSGIAQRQSEQLVRTEVEANVSEEVSAEIDKASAELSSRLLGPLGRMQLDPLVVDLKTTEQRLAIRYRIAGDWQVAAFTPRPRALSNSLLSFQIHQSAINNACEQIFAGTKLERVDDLLRRIADQFGIPAEKIPQNAHDDVRIQLAPTRPVSVVFDEDQVTLTLRVARLTNDRGLDLTRFVVEAHYRPVVDGMQTRLEMVGVLSIDGPRLGIRERLPVRAIFTQVLDTGRPLPLIAESLALHPAAAGATVGALELIDGWLSLSITPRDEQESPSRVAGGIESAVKNPNNH